MKKEKEIDDVNQRLERIEGKRDYFKDSRDQLEQRFSKTVKVLKKNSIYAKEQQKRFQKIIKKLKEKIRGTLSVRSEIL